MNWNQQGYFQKIYCDSSIPKLEKIENAISEADSNCHFSEHQVGKEHDFQKQSKSQKIIQYLFCQQGIHSLLGARGREDLVVKWNKIVNEDLNKRLRICCNYMFILDNFYLVFSKKIRQTNKYSHIKKKNSLLIDL